jgi:DNA repair protein RecO (recombination protein O)
MSEDIVEEGIILKKIPYSEADEIITVLLKTGGVRRLFVAGSRKSRKRFQGLIDLFSLLKFQYRSNPHSLGRLQKVEELERDIHAANARFWEKDLLAYAYFSYMAELICEFTLEEIQANDLFDLWGEAVRGFQDRPFSAVSAASYLIRIFTDFGYALELNQCASCRGTEPNPAFYFVPEKGGLMCGACAALARVPQTFTVSQELLQAMRASPQTPVRSVSLEKEAAFAIRRVLSFSHQILQKKTRAEGFFLQMLGTLE